MHMWTIADSVGCRVNRGAGPPNEFPMPTAIWTTRTTRSMIG